MYKKVRCTCKVVVLPAKPIVVFDVPVAVALSDGNVPNYYLSMTRADLLHCPVKAKIRTADSQSDLRIIL